MNFTNVWEAISPYINITALITALSGIIAVVCNIKRTMTAINKRSDVTQLFSQALPKDLTVSVSKLAQQEIDRFIEQLKPEFIDVVARNTELTECVAKAILSLRSIPDDLKADIQSHLSEPVEEQKITLEMSKEFTKVATEAKPKVYID